MGSWLRLSCIVFQHLQMGDRKATLFGNLSDHLRKIFWTDNFEYLQFKKCVKISKRTVRSKYLSTSRTVKSGSILIHLPERSIKFVDLFPRSNLNRKRRNKI